MTLTPDPTTLPAVADRVDTVTTDLRRLVAGDGTPSARQLANLAAEAAAVTVTLLEAALPSVDDEPGTGEAFERAAELGGDARRHLVIACHLLAGVHGIVTARP